MLQACVVLSGGSKEDIENAFQYGKNIGIAFQLVDDLIDFVSSADVLGNRGEYSIVALAWRRTGVLIQRSSSQNRADARTPNLTLSIRLPTNMGSREAIYVECHNVFVNLT